MSALEFEGLLPTHAAGLTLTHNDHKTVYETVAEFLENLECVVGSAPCFVADGEREKAISTNELWELHWYPNTPVGSCTVFAATFEALVKWLAEGGGK